MNIYVNMTGLRFGKLLVIRENGRVNEKKNILWLCKCDCGIESNKRGSDLRSGRTNSCGNCHFGRLDDIEVRQRISDKNLTLLSEYKGVNVLVKILCHCGNKFSSTPQRIFSNDTTSCGCLKSLGGIRSKMWKGYGDISSSYFSSVRNSAKSRGLELGVTIEQIWELFLKQNRKCALSGIDISFEPNFGKFYRNQTASLDRINSDIGYVLDNIQWVHKDWNISKQDKTDEDFINMCHLISDYQRNKVKYE